MKSFPIDCFQLLAHYGYKIYTYSELKKKNITLYDMCLSYSDDAFRIGNLMIIAYNEEKPKTRIRFSLMHELGHHILEHKNDSPENENEANYFSSNILAPRIAMYYTKRKKIKEIADIFEISEWAAYYAAQDFSEWCNGICRDGMQRYDRELYNNFYNAEYDGFVYSIKKCEFCGVPVYNEQKPYCKTACKIDFQQKTKTIGLTYLTKEDKITLHRLENRWLYDF